MGIIGFKVFLFLRGIKNFKEIEIDFDFVWFNLFVLKKILCFCGVFFEARIVFCKLIEFIELMFLLCYIDIILIESNVVIGWYGDFMV